MVFLPQKGQRSRVAVSDFCPIIEGKDGRETSAPFSDAAMQEVVLLSCNLTNLQCAFNAFSIDTIFWTALDLFTNQIIQFFFV